MIQPELFSCREKPSVTILSEAMYTPDRDVNIDEVVKTKFYCLLLPSPPLKTDSPNPSPTHYMDKTRKVEVKLNLKKNSYSSPRNKTLKFRIILKAIHLFPQYFAKRLHSHASPKHAFYKPILHVKILSSGRFHRNLLTIYLAPHAIQP
jgi:hypothetical protein